jgi:hypothetical protein
MPGFGHRCSATAPCQKAGGEEGRGGGEETDNNRLPSLPLQRAIVGRQVISYHSLTGLLK